MKTKFRNVMWAALLVAAASLTPQVRADDLKAEAQQAISSLKQKDPTLQTYFDTAAGYAVFPDISEGAFIVGGAHGKGVVYEKGKAIGQATVTKATIGAQAGGQSFAEVVFFQTPEALRQFKGSSFEMSAGVSAVMASEGAAQTAKYQDGVAVFTLPKKGVMASAAVGGQKFKFEPFD